MEIYTVSEINTQIKNILESNQNLRNIWIKGEISNFTHHSSGHMYFSLKDKYAVLDCAMFDRVNKSLKFTLENGMKVVVRGNISVYKPRGRYQLIIEELQPEGLGELYLRFIQLKQKLQKEGLFAEEHKKPIPKYPKVIGIVTSPTGAVIRDIINVIKRRYSCVQLIIAPALVQGDNAAITIKQAVELLNNVKDIDVIIIARGGGSLEELWPFNEETVARAIFNSNIPIISAVGHETDSSIADFVADKRAATPSAAAELTVPNREELSSQLQIYKKQMVQNLINYINQYKQFIDEQTTSLLRNISNNLKIHKKDLESLKGKLETLNPKAVLERGYSITMKDNKIIKSVKELMPKNLINIIIKDGKIKSQVEELTEVKENG